MFSPAHELSKRKWIALPAIALGFWGKPKAFFVFERRIIDPLGASTISTMRGDQQRPVTAEPTNPPGISSQPRESFTLTS
jgi:hypothetical protein